MQICGDLGGRLVLGGFALGTTETWQCSLWAHGSLVSPSLYFSFPSKATETQRAFVLPL